MNPTNPIETQIAATVLEAWVGGKDGLTVKEIASTLTVSESKVRRAFDARHGFLPGVRYFQGEVPTYSRSYPGMQAGVARVGMYRPDDDTLRAEIRILRERLDKIDRIQETHEHA